MANDHVGDATPRRRGRNDWYPYPPCDCEACADPTLAAARLEQWRTLPGGVGIKTIPGRQYIVTYQVDGDVERAFKVIAVDPVTARSCLQLVDDDRVRLLWATVTHVPRERPRHFTRARVVGRASGSRRLPPEIVGHECECGRASGPNPIRCSDHKDQP